MASFGGVDIVNQGIACTHLPLQTFLKAVAVQAIIFNELTAICSVYILPHHNLQKNEFQSLTDQLREPWGLQCT